MVRRITSRLFSVHPGRMARGQFESDVVIATEMAEGLPGIAPGQGRPPVLNNVSK
jgi:hypothetical protein